MLRLTPQHQLRWHEPAPPATLTPYQEAFERDWREGLLVLSAHKHALLETPILYYWQRLGQLFLGQLCLQPAEAPSPETLSLPESESSRMLLIAPPMTGGEYITQESLRDVWAALQEWVAGEIRAVGGLASFLQEWAPAWHQVGRVCFHLAENPKDGQRPFAFMATYTTGLGAAGKAKHLPLRQALKQYAGAKNKAGLRKLLTPVQQAAKACEWVADLVASRQLYQPMAWTPERAYQLLKDSPTLEESGLMIRLPDWWKRRKSPRIAVTIDAGRRTTMTLGSMLNFQAEIALGDEHLTPEELEALLQAESGLISLKGQWVELDKEKLQEALEQWESLQQIAAQGEISFIEGMRLLAGTSADLKDDEDIATVGSWLDVQAGKALRALLDQLRDPSQLEAPSPGPDFQATLRPYQEQGLAWMHLLTSLGLGACLADDMGLGKTLQTLALLQCARKDAEDAQESRPPSLLVLPASLLANWKAEAERFAPTLKLTFYHAAMASRQQLDAIAASPQAQLEGTDLVVTTYGMLLRQEWMAEQPWHLVILDEAQAIKNPRTKQTRAIKKLTSHARVALTGTPVENRLGDLWSLFDFLNPGLLGSSSTFKSFVAQLEQRWTDQFAPLRKLVGPYILRRMKTDRSIIADLPEKTEMIQYCNLTKRQVKQYQQVIDDMEEALDSAESIARKGLVLTSLMRLKQVCNHPSQILGDDSFDPRHSGKFQRIAEICEGIAERQEKVLVFTQFREVIAPLAAHLATVFGRQGLMLHGGTSVKQRKAAVEEFQDPDGPPFFILSLKAGGTGLNLTAASHVIHFDRWWNPAVEDQATDRAFRIGQQRNVLVHKFVTSGTVEERIHEIIAEKKGIAQELLSNDGEIKLTELDNDALFALVKLNIDTIAN